MVCETGCILLSKTLNGLPEPRRRDLKAMFFVLGVMDGMSASPPDSYVGTLIPMRWYLQVEYSKGDSI